MSDEMAEALVTSRAALADSFVRHVVLARQTSSPSVCAARPV